MNLSNSVAYSFGNKIKTSEFDKWAKSDNPGPGNYNEESYFKTKNNCKSYKFGNDPKETKIKSITPGPGFYEKRSDNIFGKGSPKFTMSKKKRGTDFSQTIVLNTNGNLKTEETPGPGQYSIDSIEKTRARTPSYKIPLSSKDINYDNKLPGPGYYDADRKVIKNNNPQYSLGKSIRDDLWGLEKGNKNVEETPGPGRYSLTPKLGQGPKAIIKGKEFYNPIKIVPGPGEYELNKSAIFKKTPGGKIGSATRDSKFFIAKENETIPGPGLYSDISSFDLTKSKGFKFTKDLKYKTPKTNAPGPGSYFIPSSVGSVASYERAKLKYN